MNQNQKNFLEIDNLHAKIQNKDILNGINLSINLGEVHVIMGKNGSGKSTLAKVIAGHPSYDITDGQIYLEQENINQLLPEERSQKGLFLAFQYPVEIPGVSNLDFLRIAYNNKQKYQLKQELDPLSFYQMISKKMEEIDMDSKFLTRNLNDGFSGGEKKKNEILQMSLLDSQLVILDETDSGLDIDALKTISKAINSFKEKNKAVIIITHYQRLLEYIVPDYVHIMENGRIVYKGNRGIVKQLEKYGYEYIKEKL
uniref:Probable ATP-dependent transporter ycf16 n=1 Tax=Crouania attenuata TaxID=42002 RepID=A0A4D6WPM9_9FLOR|nr:iron-sulfur cluster formation ABC transporter ATP-binding subunit [Crouania attenuata]